MNVVRIAQSAPWWAWALLVLIIWRGIAAHSGRPVPLLAVMIQPTIFVVWGLATIKTFGLSSPVLVLIDFVSFIGGTLLATTLTDAAAVRVDRPRQMIALPASWWPMCRSLIIFAARFGLAIGAALLPDKRDSLQTYNVVVS